MSGWHKRVESAKLLKKRKFANEVHDTDMVQNRFFCNRNLRFAFLGTLLLLISSCASGRLDPLKPVGQNAKDIDGIMRLSAWMAIAVGLFVGAAVIAVIFKFRVRHDDDPDELPEQIHGNKKSIVRSVCI